MSALFDRARAAQALGEAFRHFYQRPNPRVSFLDVGRRIHDEHVPYLGEEICLRVHLRDKPRLPEAQLELEAGAQFVDKDELRQLTGLPVDLPEGDYRWHTALAPQAPGWAGGRPAALSGGMRVSNDRWGRSFGTLGGGVRDRASGAAMILSNWHVLGIGVGLGSPVYRPARFYGPGQPVGRLSAHGIDRGLDAAVARLDEGQTLENYQRGIGPVTGPGDPAADMAVTKSGAASGVTLGRVSSLVGGVAFSYGNGSRRVLRDVWHVASVGGEVSRPGDSGAWWLEQDSRRAVGLHFAGSDRPEHALFISMPAVLSGLGLELDTSS